MIAGRSYAGPPVADETGTTGASLVTTVPPGRRNGS